MKKIDNSPHVKGFNFKDPRIMDGKWIHEPNRDMIRDFFRMLLRKGKSNFFALSSMNYPYLVPNTDPFTFWYRKYEKLNAAKASVSADRDEKIEQAADSIERDLDSSWCYRS